MNVLTVLLQAPAGAAGGGDRGQLALQHALGKVLHLGGIGLLAQVIGHGHAAQEVNVHVKQVQAKGQGHKTRHTSDHQNGRDNQEELKMLYKAKGLIGKHLTSPPCSFLRRRGRDWWPLRPPAPSS